jgi:hypothetical protein
MTTSIRRCALNCRRTAAKLVFHGGAKQCRLSRESMIVLLRAHYRKKMVSGSEKKAVTESITMAWGLSALARHGETKCEG